MGVIDELVERRIRHAQEQGQFDDLPGEGEPLRLDDDSQVPAELRVAYRILKNAGYLPRELQLRREINDVQQLITQATCEELKKNLSRRMQFLCAQLAVQGHEDLRNEQTYFNKLLARDKK